MPAQWVEGSWLRRDSQAVAETTSPTISTRRPSETIRYPGPGKGIMMSPRTTSSPPATKIDLDAMDRGSHRVAAARSVHPKLSRVERAIVSKSSRILDTRCGTLRQCGCTWRPGSSRWHPALASARTGIGSASVESVWSADGSNSGWYVRRRASHQSAQRCRSMCATP